MDGASGIIFRGGSEWRGTCSVSWFETIPVVSVASARHGQGKSEGDETDANLFFTHPYFPELIMCLP